MCADAWCTVHSTVRWRWNFLRCHGWNVIPYLSGEMAAGDVAISTVFLGTAAQVARTDFTGRLADRPEVTFEPTGTAQISWRGRSLEVPMP